MDTLKDTCALRRNGAAITVTPEPGARRPQGYIAATDLADIWSDKAAFRDAHEAVAHAVKAAISHQVDLSELPLEVLQAINPKIEKDVYDVLSPARLAQCP